MAFDFRWCFAVESGLLLGLVGGYWIVLVFNSVMRLLCGFIV